MRFLADASARLNASLDYQTTLADVAQLAVPTIADWCVVDIVTDDGDLERLAIAHADPAKVDLAWEVYRRYPADVNAPGGPRAVVARGELQHVPDIPDAMLVASAHDPDHLALLRALGLRSYLAVPLVARERILGVVSLVQGDSGRRFTAEDVALVQELASRAALAIDNARLYHAEREARQAAEAAVRLREEFLSIASHELRTPLTSIKANAQLAARRVRLGEQQPGRIEHLLNPLLGEVDRLELLVNDLLNATQLQRGQLELRRTEVDLVDLARQVIERFSNDLAPSPVRRLYLVAAEPVIGSWDAGRLDQVLTNLVSNALKYSAADAPVTVSVRREGEMAVIDVEDRGIGLTPEEQDRLFQPFVRSERARALTGGTGLGLFIAAQIVHRHGGSIEVQSVPGAGSTFQAILPLRPPNDGTSDASDQR